MPTPLPGRILQVHTRYREAGGEDVVLDAHRDLLVSAGSVVRRLQAANADSGLHAALQLGMAPWNPVSAVKARLLANSMSPDIAHIHNTWFAASPSVITALRAAEIPSVMTLHNYRLTCLNAQLLRGGQPCTLCVGSHPWRGVKFRCYRGSFLGSAAAAATLSLNRLLGTWEHGIQRFLVFTSFQRDLMVDAGIDAGRIDIVPNFVADPGERLEKPTASNMLLYVGRLSAEKGVDRLVDAWKRVAPTDARMVLAGDGPLRSRLQAQQIAGLEFVGHVGPDEVRRLMLNARILLFPTIWYEAQPMVLLEAMAAGLPVTAPAIGAVKSTLGDSAIWAEATDWAAVLEGLLDFDEAELTRSSRSGRQRYLDEFTPARTLERLADSYESARVR